MISAEKVELCRERLTDEARPAFFAVGFERVDD